MHSVNESYNRSEALKFIDVLIAEIDNLLEKQILGSDFKRWHGDVVDFLSSIYGKNSPELGEFSSIRFTPPSELLNTAKTIEDSSPIPFLPQNQYPHGISPQVHYYRQRLHQARELLIAIRLKMQTDT